MVGVGVAWEPGSKHPLWSKYWQRSAISDSRSGSEWWEEVPLALKKSSSSTAKSANWSRLLVYALAIPGVKLGPSLKESLGQGNSVLRPAFFRQWRSLARHPALSFGMFTLKAVELAAVVQVAVEQSVLRRSPSRAAQVYRSAP